MPRRWWAMGPNTAFHSAANAGTTQRNGSPKMPPERPGSNCSGESEYAARKPSSGCGTAPRTSAPAPPTEAPRVLQKGLKGEGGDPRTLPPRDASTLDSKRCRARGSSRYRPESGHPTMLFGQCGMAARSRCQCASARSPEVPTSGEATAKDLACHVPLRG